MTTELPTVYVYVYAIGPEGAERISRYTFLGDDHEAAVKAAVEWASPRAVREVFTFDGPPRRWRVGTEVEEL